MIFSEHLESFGLIIDPHFPKYFCTPVNATVFASTGCDGIHFCILNTDKDDLKCPVYVVSPMSDTYVSLVARSYNDFLALLFSCKDASLLEALSYMEQEAFYQAIAEVSQELNSDEERHRAMCASVAFLNSKIEIPTIEDVYSYVHNLKKDNPFDATLVFSKAYWSIVDSDL